MNLDLNLKITERHNKNKDEDKTQDNSKSKKTAGNAGNNTAELHGQENGHRVSWMQGSHQIFENKSEWLTTAEAATYLRKFRPEGKPSMNAVHKLVSQGRIRRRKFSGRLYFKRNELDYLIESSEA